MQAFVLLFFSLCVLFQLIDLQGVYTKAVHYTQNNQPTQKNQKVKRKLKAKKNKNKATSIFVFGDKPVDSAMADESYYTNDKYQNEELLKTLAQAASSDQRTAFIIDSSTNEARKALERFLDYPQLVTEAHIGIRTHQSFFALAHGQKFGSIDFIFAEQSGPILLELIRTVESLDQSLGFFKFKNKKEKLSLFFACQDQDIFKNKLVSTAGSFIRKRLNSTIAGFTVKEFAEELNEIEKHMPQNGILELIKNRLYLDSAREFIKGYPDETFLKDVVWHTFKHQSLMDLQNAVRIWMYPLHSYVANNDLKIATSRALKKYPAVIISCLQNRTELIDLLMKKKKYSLERDCSSKRVFVNALGFSELLDTYRDQIDAKFHVHSCDGCFKEETSPNQFFQCAGCPKFWYCSERCAKKFTNHNSWCMGF